MADTTQTTVEVTPTEYEVLCAIWDGHPASAQQIISRLQQQRDWHEKTVKTLLNRMLKKGAVDFIKQGKTYLYLPLLDQQQYHIQESQSLVQRLFGGRVSPLVAGFAKGNKLDKQDIDELKALIDQWERDHD